ncbi:MAG: hypothetical protein NC935_07670 [Candidatus Omnitrophica bacterium]|nr:hypothetical protein [Candidatus Omnitrophota bacterium]
MRYLFLLILISLVPLRSLLHPGMFISHDSELHVARLASFYKSFTEGNLFPRWGANFNNNLGNPTLMFLYPLPNYFGLPFIALGFSFIDTVKILFALGFILSGIFMFLLLSEIFSQKTAFAGSLIYLFSPYRFVDIFVRGALPEHLFLMLAPLSLFLLIKYYQKPTKLKFVISSIFLSSLTLVHIASSVFYLPFIYILLLIIFLNKKRKYKFIYDLIVLALPFIISILLTLFYWFPAVVEGKYTLRRLIINKQFSASHLVDLKQLIIPRWGFGDPRISDGFSTQIGIINLLILSVLITLFILKKMRVDKLTLYLFVIYFVCIFLMTKYSKFIWLSNDILFNIHFPWRLLVLIVIINAFFGTILFQKLLKFKNIYLVNIAIVVLTFGVLLTTKDYHKPQGYFSKNDNYYLKDYVSFADNGESLPIWTTLDVQSTHKYPLEIIEGQAQITNVLRESELHKYLVMVEKDGTNFLENTLYFPGWNVYDNGVNITQMIEYQDPNYKGLITFRLPYGRHEITVKFENTRVREMAKLVSLIGLLLLLLPLKVHILGYEQ